MTTPQFSLPDQNNKVHTLADYKGQWIVIYIYPKDDTPGCTAEACAFRDVQNELKKLGVQVLGISRDHTTLHKMFHEKNSLTFPLLSDPEHRVIEALGAWGVKKFMGKQFMGVHRNTYIINPHGEIIKEYKDVNPLTHTSHVLEDLEHLIVMHKSIPAIVV